jgi:uncharacterized delta-60 repeat protein
MAARIWLDTLNSWCGAGRRRYGDHGRLRRRLLCPGPELLEDRTLLSESLPAGSLDPSFNSAGWVTAQVGSSDAGGAGAVERDGKIVIAGAVTGSGGEQTIAVVRYLPTGQLDNSFGPAHSGVVVLDPAWKMVAAHAVAVINDFGWPDDGKIVVVGTWNDANANQTGVALARFNGDGSLDQSGFGNGGIHEDNWVPSAQGMAAALLPDDEIVVGGLANIGASAQPIGTAFVERFSSTGALDRTYGAPGVDTPLFGGVSSTMGGVAWDRTKGDIVAAGKLTTGDGSALIAVARVQPDGFLDPSFGAGGIVTTNPTDAGGNAGVESVDGVAIDAQRAILIAGTTAPTASTSEDVVVARYDVNGNIDPAFNHQLVKIINFQQSGQSNADFARGIAVGSDGKIIVALDTAVPIPGQGGSVGPGKIALARLNSDGTLDVAFGQRGQVVTDLGTTSQPVDATPQSVIVQQDGNIVVTGETSDTLTGAGSSAFAVARYVGTVASGSGAIPAGAYQEDFSNNADPTRAGLDDSGVYQHHFWRNAQPDGPTSPSDVERPGWDLEQFQSASNFALHLSGATDTITFPELRADVQIGLVSVDVAPFGPSDVTFVGDNGTYTAHVVAGDNETISAGESHVLKSDADGNPTLELGPIREIILDSADADFDNVKILVIPGQGPLDDFVTAAPDVPTTIDLLDYATGAAAAAGLSLPLSLVGFTQPSLTGSQTAQSSAGDGEIQYTPGQGHGLHPTDVFNFTVQDSSGKRATGAVYVTLDRPPQLSVKQDFPATQISSGWVVPHGQPGPLTGVITLSDAEADQVTLTIESPAASGTVTLEKVSDDQYAYQYNTPTIISYDPSHVGRDPSATGLSSTISAIVGNDQFTLLASDGLAVTPYTIRYIVPDQPPMAPSVNLQLGKAQVPSGFVVPENTGTIYYPTDPKDPQYQRELVQPGIVHFAAPGVLWNKYDPDLDPIMALEDASSLPQHGTVYLYPDGSFNYTPSPGFVGTDSFGYYASDGYQASDLSYVLIRVVPGTASDPVRNAPVLRDDHYDYQMQPTLPPGPTPPVVGEFSPLITANDLARTPSSGVSYPDMAMLIRPIFVIAGIELLKPLWHFNSTSMHIYENLGLFYQDNQADGTHSLEMHVEAADFGAGNVSTNSESILKDQFLTLSTPTYISLTYAYLSSDGWFSNFATVVVHVFPMSEALSGNSVTLLDGSGQPIVYTSPPGTGLAVFKLDPTQTLAQRPSDLQLPYGLSEIDLSDVHPVGASVVVTITLPRGAPHVTTYYKYGIQLPTDTDHYYSFLYSQLTGVGAEFTSDPNTGQQVIRLHLRDGGLGDDDLFANGLIIDPGGLAISRDPARNSVATLNEDVLRRGPSDSEMTHWVQKLDRGESRLKVVKSIWNSDEHRRLQVEEWSIQFLGHAADARQQARWVSLLRRGRGEIAVEQAVLTSADYRRAHPTMASFIAGLNQDVLGQQGDPINPSTGGHRRRGRPVSAETLAREAFTSPAAAAILAQKDATTFLGRPATAEETRADRVILRRDPVAISRIAERIMSSESFYEFVNSALPAASNPAHSGRQGHTARQIRRH